MASFHSQCQGAESRFPAHAAQGDNLANTLSHARDKVDTIKSVGASVGGVNEQGVTGACEHVRGDVFLTPWLSRIGS